MIYKSQFKKIDTYDWFCGPGYVYVCIFLNITLEIEPKICLYTAFKLDLVSSGNANLVSIYKVS